MTHGMLNFLNYNFKVWDIIGINTTQNCQTIHIHNYNLYSPVNFSTSGVDGGNSSTFKSGQGVSLVSPMAVSPMAVSWLWWKLRLRRLFLEGVGPCFFLGVVTFWSLFRSCFFTISWQDKHTWHKGQHRLQEYSGTEAIIGLFQHGYTTPILDLAHSNGGVVCLHFLRNTLTFSKYHLKS